MKRSLFQLIATCLFVFCVGNSAFAQGGGQTQTLVTDGVDQQVFLAPDFKFTEVDGQFANLAGAYGGWLIDRKLLLGGGGYFLTNRSDDLKMAYGGLVVEYFVNATHLVHFSLKGLVGGGQATLSAFPGDFRRLSDPTNDIWPAWEQTDNRFGFPGHAPFGSPGYPSFDGTTLSSLDPIEEGFFVVEPEASVMLNITETFKIGLGGGYRFIGAAGRIDDRLEGFTANVALKISL